MNELEATPGPWFIRKGDEWIKDIVTQRGELPNGEPNYWNLASVNIQREEADANLHLFHASRDLYEALEELLGLIENERPDWQHPEQKAAMKALRKARGELS